MMVCVDLITTFQSTLLRTQRTHKHLNTGNTVRSDTICVNEPCFTYPVSVRRCGTARVIDATSVASLVIKCNNEVSDDNSRQPKLLSPFTRNLVTLANLVNGANLLLYPTCKCTILFTTLLDILSMIISSCCTLV